tara:strand:+ start:1492 stop:3132 length:1641 start_codon:yes stop_codon:yes gene_type:complete
MPLAPALLIPFAEAVGLSIAGLGAIEIGKKVQDFIEDNPEISMDILTTLVPGNMGLNTLFKDKDAPSTKDIVLGELGKEKGNYSDPDAEGAYSSKRGRIIKALEKAGKIKKGPDKDYDPSKKYKDYKKFYEKADGGAIGIEVLFEEKKDGGRIGFANGGDNIIGSTIDKFFSGPAMDTYTKDYMESVKAPSTFDYNIASNKAAGQFIQDKTKELLGDNPVSNVVGQAATYAGVPLSIMASPFYETAQIISDKRMEPGSGVKGFYDAFMDERPFSTAIERGAGVLQSTPLGEAIYNLGGKAADLVSGIRNTNIGDFFFAPAGAADFQGGEMLQTPTRTNVQGRDLEADLGTRINPNIQPQQNIFQRAGDVAQKGIGFLKDSPGMLLSAATGIPFAGSILSGLGNMFEYRGGMGYVDEDGVFRSADELDKLNARGGYYTDAARASRNRASRIQNMLARQAAGKRISEQNLLALQEQQAREEAARQAAFNEIMSQGNNQQDFYDSLNQGQGSTAVSGNPNTSGAGDMPGYSGPTTFAKGGIATMFVEKR